MRLFRNPHPWSRQPPANMTRLRDARGHPCGGDAQDHNSPADRREREGPAFRWKHSPN